MYCGSGVVMRLFVLLGLECLGLSVIGSASCTAPNLALCCETEAECAELDRAEPTPCRAGVCVEHKCQESGCDGDEDCGDAFCVEGVCVACLTNDACDVATPICDQATHECRRCAGDVECDSGICDTPTGTCASESAILYASPGGTEAAPCTRQEPCALSHAFALVDAVRPYVEMTAGMYSTGGTLDAKQATLVGVDATLRVPDLDGQLAVRNGGRLAIRHLSLRASANDAIFCGEGSTLDIDDLDAIGPGVNTDGCPSVTVSNSSFVDGTVTFSDGGLEDAGVVIDRSKFFGKGPVVVGGSFFAKITNCLMVISSPTEYAIQLRELFNGSPRIETRIAFNTMVGGRVFCSDPQPTPARVRLFEGNIFAQTAILPSSTYCVYKYNLLSSNQQLPEMNLNGDPKFVDPAVQDFHLQTGSPAINAADPTAPDDHDLDNAPRPFGGRADMGAYERQQ